jgi:HAD superfamily hydrolase (TIGR01509 family)
MIKGAIFDLDGTLLDSMFIWDTIGEKYLRSLGYEPKENLNETFKNMSLYQAVSYYKSEYGVPLSHKELMDGVNKMVEKYYTDEVLLKQGVGEILEKLHNRGIKMCIATATDRYPAEAALKRNGIDKYFSEIFTCSEVGVGKDNPTIYKKALEHLETAKTETVIIEDAFFAIKTAKENGFITVGIYDKYEKNQKEIKQTADYYVTSFKELEEILK